MKALQDFNEELAVNIITNTFNDHSYSTGSVSYNPVVNLNPGAKWLEAFEEKRLKSRLIAGEGK